MGILFLFILILEGIKQDGVISMNKDFLFLYRLLLLLVIISILLLTFRNTNQIEIMNLNNQQDSLYNVLKGQKQYTDSLLILIKDFKTTEPNIINNYFKNEKDEKIKIIHNYTIDEHILFFTKWYSSRKISNR
jgi:hypothetical protein